MHLILQQIFEASWQNTKAIDRLGQKQLNSQLRLQGLPTTLPLERERKPRNTENEVVYLQLLN